MAGGIAEALAQVEETRVNGTCVSPVPTWPAGIDKHLADRARKLAAVQRRSLKRDALMVGDRVSEETERVTVDLLGSGEARVRGTFVERTSGSPHR